MTEKFHLSIGVKFLKESLTGNDFEPFMIDLAWAFVALRIIHSLVQLTFNLVLLRFVIFVIGWLVLAVMACSQLL